MRGGLRENSPGVWEVRLEAGRDPVSGKRRQVSRTLRGSKRQAQQLLNSLVADADAGRVSGTSATFKQLTDEWLSLSGPDLSPTTLRRYRGLLDKRILPALGPRSIHSIRSNDLDRMYQALIIEVGLSPGSVRQVHAVIRRAFRQAVRWGWVASNPALNATPPRAVRSMISPPDPAQVEQLIRRAGDADPSFARFLRVAAASGARRGEVCALRWRNLDPVSGTLTLDTAIIEVLGGLAEKDTKTHASRRIAIDSGTLAVLEDQRQFALNLAKRGGSSLTEESFIFSHEPDGASPWAPDFVTKRFQILRDDLGLPELRLHDLRHFAATRLLAAGVPVRTVSGRLGHASPSTTLSVYAHFLEASDQDAATVMGGLLPRRGE
jgi:integrase